MPRSRDASSGSACLVNKDPLRLNLCTHGVREWCVSGVYVTCGVYRGYVCCVCMCVMYYAAYACVCGVYRLGVRVVCVGGWEK